MTRQEKRTIRRVYLTEQTREESKKASLNSSSGKGMSLKLLIFEENESVTLSGKE
jgi:hypothetical protein